MSTTHALPKPKRIDKNTTVTALTYERRLIGSTITLHTTSGDYSFLAADAPDWARQAVGL